MRIVYVVQNQHHHVDGQLVPKFDLRAAERWGTLVYLLSPTARPFSGAGIVRELHQKLSKYDPDHDHLLLLGNPCLIGWSTAIAARYGNGRVSLLQWDGKIQDYASIPVNLRG